MLKDYFNNEIKTENINVIETKFINVIETKITNEIKTQKVNDLKPEKNIIHKNNKTNKTTKKCCSCTIEKNRDCFYICRITLVMSNC